MRLKFFSDVLIVLVLMSVLYSNLWSTGEQVNFSQCMIVSIENPGKLEQKAVVILQDEIYKRTGLRLKSTADWPDKSQPVIALGLQSQIDSFAGPYSNILQKKSSLGSEGYCILTQQSPQAAILVMGHDPRGILYGVGKLLRQLYLKPGSIHVPEDLKIETTPRYPIRGHQLGYRPKTNAYDAWDVPQFDQYIRELAIFGANSIEIMPPRTDDDLTSRHMKLSPMEMMIRQADIIDSYGMDVWIWYPNMGQDYSHPDSIAKELNERDQIFSKLKRIDVVFVPGGDPGDLHPNILFAWLDQVAGVLHTYHPDAKIWVSPQAFRPTKDWLDAFYKNVNKKYSWFGGVVFGPWVKTPLPEMRQIVDKSIPIRRYPDITHSISCQYPVKDWDLAFAMTLGRECYNPRPKAEKIIHNALDNYAHGSLSYSEGINDDVNKFIWSAQDWDPEISVISTLREYVRFFIGPQYTEDIAQAILALEENWEGPLIANPQVELTLQQWQSLEGNMDPNLAENYRFQMGLLRAYYDAYIKDRLIYETELQRNALELLRGAAIKGSDNAIQLARSLLHQAWEKPVAQDYYKRCWGIADFLFQKIGSQLSVAKHNAMPGRGDFMDYIDIPLNDAIWLLSQFDKIISGTDEETKVSAIYAILNRTNPGPAGFYNNFGQVTSKQRLVKYTPWEEDPGSLLSPRVSFGVGLRGEEWIHTVEAKGFDGSATPLAWMNQITTLYDTPLSIEYDELDSLSTYRIKVAYTGRFRSKIKLTADQHFQIHDFIQTGIQPIMQFSIPEEATMDGKLKLTWTCPEGQRGAQVAEIWLQRMQ